MKLDKDWEPAATLGVAFLSAIALTCVLAATGGTRPVDADLVTYAVLTVLVAVTARWWTALVSAAILWFFFDGFFVNRHGDIAWHGTVDAWRLGVITAAAVGALLVRRVVRFTARMLPQDLEALREADDTQLAWPTDDPR